MTMHMARKVAVAAMCDPRTVLAFSAGRPVRELTALRIRAALRRLRVAAPKGPKGERGRRQMDSANAQP
jgi:hypothetical protein